eukprot:scaffold191814_cov48-Prasinocladus_malaysianus.AAC.1
MLAAEIQASPYYQRSQGRDHLLVFSHWRVRKGIFQLKTNYYFQPADRNRRMHNAVDEFEMTVRNFILGSVLQTGAYNQVPDVFWAPEAAKVILIPYLPPNVLPTCSYSDLGRVICSDDGTAENHITLAEYRRSRNHTLFFVGNTARSESNESGNVRPLVVDQLGEVYPPNILASTSQDRRDSKRPLCSPKVNMLTGCHLRSMPAADVNQLMHQSLFSLHVRGDDAGSSRVELAIASGTLQIFLANRFYQDKAAFKCRVPWAEMVYHVDDRDFLKSPAFTMQKALSELLDTSLGKDSIMEK